MLPLALSAGRERSHFLKYPTSSLPEQLVTALGTFLIFYIESLSPSVAQAGLESSVSLVLGLQHIPLVLRFLR